MTTIITRAPHSAYPLYGSFSRSWVVPEVTDANWNEAGVIYRGANDEVVYATVQHIARDDDWAWYVTKYSEGEGRVDGLASDPHPSRSAAIEALMREVQQCERERGPVSRDEWPTDRGTPWFITSISRGAAP